MIEEMPSLEQEVTNFEGDNNRIATFADIKSFLDKYEWNESEQPIVKEIFRRCGSLLHFRRKCSGVNKTCIWWQQGVCLSDRKKCVPDNGEESGTENGCVCYRTANVDVNAKTLARTLFLHNTKLQEDAKKMLADYRALQKVVEDLELKNKELRRQNESLIKERMDSVNVTSSEIEELKKTYTKKINKIKTRMVSVNAILASLEEKYNTDYDTDEETDAQE